MAPINDEDIDPALRSNDTDPSMQFFARHSQPESNHGDTPSELGGVADDFRSHSPAFQDYPDTDEAQGTKGHDLIAFSKMISQKKKLSDKATADFNIYCEASTIYHQFRRFLLKSIFYLFPD